MSLPRQFTIVDGAYALDGGSIFLAFRGDDDVQHELVLVQHRIPMDLSDPRNPERLYLDNQIIQVRSVEELRLLSDIKTASISPLYPEHREPKGETGPVHVLSEDIAEFMAATRASPKAAIQHLVDSLVEFVESEKYVQLAARLGSDDSA
jgi:hypothetical protein